MMNNEILHPNCSEVCWRLDITNTLPIKEQICESLQKNHIEDDDNYNMYGESAQLQDMFEDMLSTLQYYKKRKLQYKKIELEFGEGGGGGGDYQTVEDCFNYAMEVCEGKITTAKALKLLEAEVDRDNIVDNGF